MIRLLNTSKSHKGKTAVSGFNYPYRQYRTDIQAMIDKKVEILLQDSWNKVNVNKEKFFEYINIFKGNK